MQPLVDGAEPAHDELHPDGEGEQAHDLDEHAHADGTGPVHDAGAEGEHHVIHEHQPGDGGQQLQLGAGLLRQAG